MTARPIRITRSPCVASPPHPISHCPRGVVETDYGRQTALGCEEDPFSAADSPFALVSALPTRRLDPLYLRPEVLFAHSAARSQPRFHAPHRAPRRHPPLRAQSAPHATFDISREALLPITLSAQCLLHVTLPSSPPRF